jgi:hypothetical protein
MMKSLTYLFYFLLFCVTIVSSTTFFVSPTGSDVTGDGSNQNPWASWSHSSISLRPLLPTMTENFNVVFLEGRYFITETVVLGLQDSGQNGYSVIYSSASNNASDVIIDGGLQISSWSVVGDPALGVYTASLPCNTREVYAFGQRVQESPAVGVNLTSKNTVITEWGYLTSESSLISLITAPGSLVKDADVEFIYTSAAAQWQESRARVQSWSLVNETWLNITMVQPGFSLVRGKAYAETLPTSLVNVLVLESLLPGQGVLSPSRNAIFYHPPISSGGSMQNANAWVASIDGELVLLEGKALTPSSSPLFVHNIRIENITFQGSTWLAPLNEGAYAPDQGGIVYRASDLAQPPLGGHAVHPVPAALTLRTAANISLFGVVVEHTGGTAIAVEGGSQDISISRVFVSDAGCSAVRLGQVDDADLTNPLGFNARLSLSDSTFSGIAQGYRDCSGIFGGFISDSVIEHNNLTNSNWAGLTLGWGGWGGCAYRPNLGGNKIIGNAISYVNLITGDGGPIYVMAQQQSRANCSADDLSCRSEMAFNYVSFAMHHAALLYHDEGSAFYYTHDNVVLQPELTDPHGWWWSWAAAWASSESNILITNNYAQGVNRSDVYKGNNLVIQNNSLQPIGATWPDAALQIINQAGPRVQN